MRIAITGHTSGIGKAILARATALGHQVDGFSRTTGHDLRTSVDAIVQAVQSHDVLVNNAHAGFAQVQLLYAIQKQWVDDPSKTILNMSSNSSDGTKGHRHPYAVQKSALDKAAEQLAGCSACRIVTLRPGYVDTPRVAAVEGKKLSADYVAEIVFWLLEQPGLVTTLTVVPR